MDSIGEGNGIPEYTFAGSYGTDLFKELEEEVFLYSWIKCIAETVLL